MNAILDLLADSARCELLASAGHARIESEFIWSAVVDRWHEELLEAVVQHRLTASSAV